MIDMAQAALRRCTKPGCKRLIRGTSRCDKHTRYQRSRVESAVYQHLYGRRWKSAARRYKQENPLCVECMTRKKVSAAYCVDHVTPHRGNEDLFWDESNWQSLCESCHNAKTAKGE